MGEPSIVHAHLLGIHMRWVYRTICILMWIFNFWLTGFCVNTHAGPFVQCTHIHNVIIPRPVSGQDKNKYNINFDALDLMCNVCTLYRPSGFHAYHKQICIYRPGALSSFGSRLKIEICHVSHAYKEHTHTQDWQQQRMKKWARPEEYVCLTQKHHYLRIYLVWSYDKDNTIKFVINQSFQSDCSCWFLFPVRKNGWVEILNSIQ